MLPLDHVEFRKDLLEDAKVSATTDGDGTTAAFTDIVAHHLIDHEILPNFESAFYQGIGFRNRKIRIDGYTLDEFDNTLYLIISHYTGSVEIQTLTRTEADQCFDWTFRLLDEAFHRNLQQRLEISIPIADLVDVLLSQQTHVRKYRILLFTDCLMSGRIEVLPLKEAEGLPVECQIWDVERLWKLCAVETDHDKVTIDFTKYVRQGLPCLETSDTETANYRCFLSVIPGEVLASVYDEYGAQLLEGNVRSFLSTKVSVNKKIRETILSSPNMFFAFNNGISATALGVTIKDTHEGKFITGAHDFQIINGGQTTASLSNAKFRDKADLTPVRVPMKLLDIHTSVEGADTLMQAIARSSNSQNKVSDADFFSTHPFHVRMEQLSRRVFAPAVGGRQYDTHWFYERARGQYLQAQLKMTRSERNRFLIQNPKTQLITKTDLAKVRNSWRGLPHIVSKGAQANFVEFAQWVDNKWLDHSDEFNEQFYRESVGLCILFRQCEHLVSHASWYEQGYRANIVTYALAWLAELIHREYPHHALDLQLIWNRQEVPDVVMKQLDVLAEGVFQAITDPSRGVVNVTQWCKQEACWKRIQHRPMTLTPDFLAVMENADEVKSSSRAARRDQKMISGIETQAEVVNLDSLYWQELLAFVAPRRLASDTQLSALKIACQMPGKLPNSVQSKHLLILRDKALLEGWQEVEKGVSKS